MITLVKNTLTRLLLPIAWSRGPDHPARTLKRFGDTESDSGWQYLQALQHTDDPGLKRMLFSNVMEEFRHADYFYGAAHQLARERLHSAAQARTPLVQAPKDLPYFLAYAHECERSVHEQFDAYAGACSLPEVADVFRRICSDEEDHEAQAHAFLCEQVGSAGVARRLVWKAKATRLYEAWMRGSQRMGDVMFGVMLSAVFFAFGPLLARRPAAVADREAVRAEPPPLQMRHHPERWALWQR